MRILAATLVLIFTTALAAAHEYKVGDISIKHPVAYPTVGRTGAGYLEIVNEGPADRLIGVSAAFPRVMLHESVQDGDVTKMEHRMAIEIPEDGSVLFKPGGLHVMFMGLSEHWSLGDEIPATLEFEMSGPVNVIFKVEDRPMLNEGEAKTDHSNHEGLDHGADKNADKKMDHSNH